LIQSFGINKALHVKHPIIDWEVHTEGQRAYWKITRLGGSSASYQFFTDLLKHLDRDNLNQLWSLVKETLSKRPATSDKEMELWVELSRLYKPNVEDQLWTHTQNFMHAPAEWKLYDKCGVHQLTSKDKDIFMLVEKDYPLRKVDVVFDDAFGGVRDEEVVVGEGMMVISSSLDMLTNSFLGGIMVSLIFLQGLDEEALVEFMVE
nr:hypothetical protein [Tanacetum cinerariifolium]